MGHLLSKVHGGKVGGPGSEGTEVAHAFHAFLGHLRVLVAASIGSVAAKCWHWRASNHGCGRLRSRVFAQAQEQKRALQARQGLLVQESSRLCPRHVVGAWAMSHQEGSRLFGGITGSSALACLREMLSVLGVERSHEFRTHDLRRGHAKDLQLSGV